MQARLSSESRRRYVFPYRKQMPGALQIETNPYLNTLLYEAACLGAEPTLEAFNGLPGSDPDQPLSPYIKPYSASTLIDPRLTEIKPSAWTNVSEDDGSLQKTLELYFLCEYHFFSAFHRDLFLDDMLSGSTQYCTPLLVNGIMALACVSVQWCCSPPNIQTRSGQLTKQELLPPGAKPAGFLGPPQTWLQALCRS